MARTETRQSSAKRSKKDAAASPKATLISSNELARMQKGFISPAEASLVARKEATERYEAQQAAFREHQRQEAKKVEEMSETDRLEAIEKAATRAKAVFQLEEQRDEVKRMNQMMLYSKCVAIRDKQVEEKKQKAAEEVARQRALDAEMEVERLKREEAQKEVEALKFEQRRAGMAILEEQIQEQEDTRQHLLALQKQEQERIKEAIEKAKEEDARQLEQKRLAGAALLRDVMAGNAAMIERKKQQRIQDILEEQRIAAFVKERDAKALAALEEKARLAKEGELEIARLRAQQEQARDVRAQADSLRAKRWQEAAARKERQEEKKRADKARADVELIAEARRAQAASKILAQAAVAKAEQAEFNAVLAKLKQEEQLSKLKETAVKDANKAHLEKLRSQVEEKQKSSAALKALAVAEGQVIQSSLQLEKATIEAIRQKKLKELRDEGIPEKYLAELARSRF